MAWVRIDDGFVEHPKIARVGMIGAWLQLQALCYCNRNLTDGFVPTAIAESFLARGTIRLEESGVQWTVGEHSGMQGLDLADVAWPAKMVEARIWEEVPGGYQVHDFSQYQPTRDRVLAERARWKARQGTHRSRGVSRWVSRRDARECHASPVPVPVPGEDILSVASQPQGAGSAPPLTTLGFDHFWATYPKKRHKPAAIRAWKGVDGARYLEAILGGVETWKASDAWRRGFVEDPSTFLRQRQWEDEPAAPQSVDPRTADNMSEIKRGLDLIGRAKGWNP